VLIDLEDADEIFIWDSVAEFDRLKVLLRWGSEMPHFSTKSGVGQMMGEKPCAVLVSSLA